MAFLIPGVGTVGTWFVVQYRVNAQEEQIEQLSAGRLANHTAITTLQANVTEVREDVSDIKEDVRGIQVEQIEQGKLLERILEKLEERPRSTHPSR